MKTIYIFRHGETDWNKASRFQGRTAHVPLNESGKKQAESLAESLSDKSIEHIFTSPALRARQTADALNACFQVGITEVEDLQERAFGLLEGVSFDEIIHTYPELEIQLKSSKNNDFTSSEGIAYNVERLSDLQKRIHDAVLSIVASTPKETIAISTHGSALLNLLIHMGVGMDRHLKNGEYVTLAFCPVKSQLSIINSAD